MTGGRHFDDDGPDEVDDESICIKSLQGHPEN